MSSPNVAFILSIEEYDVPLTETYINNRNANPSLCLEKARKFSTKVFIA